MVTEDSIDYTKELMLVVDDDNAARDVVVEMLQYIGFKVKGVSSAKNALEELGKAPYTFILTDMRMPEMDGLELIRQVKLNYPGICIIAITGYSKDYSYIDVINAGTSDFIDKPVEVEELEAKVKRALMERNIREELSRLSITDSLTGLYNQRHFYARLKEEIVRARRQKTHLGLIILDLDGFKKYNDTFGHLAGDALLQKVGNIIETQIRKGVDSGYRYGGDEFAVLLIDADWNVAQGIANRIKNSIQKTCGITSAAGYAGLSEDMAAEDLVSIADEHMYRSKRIKGKK
ncbi:MAG: diguanylate cyclase [Deltaproteobacteria bacterium]|nr:diguanylate cyclase [Deltaproteobacteria bacterium]